MVTQSDRSDGSAQDENLPHIDIDDPKALEHWADKLDCSPEQIRNAVTAVGPLAANVEMHLKGSHSTTSADETRQGNA